MAGADKPVRVPPIQRAAPPSTDPAVDALAALLPQDAGIPREPEHVRAPDPTNDSTIHEEEVPDRDRIVIIGRRQSGKTIYLAAIYAKLWKSLDGMTAKALSGEVHKQLMNTNQMLHEGHWPPSTLGTSQIDLEIDYRGRKRLLVALDFAGELFAKAFVDEQSDWPGVRELVNHIDRAAAVMLLVDPSVVAGMDKQAAMEDDFGLVQAVQRIRNWPGGEHVPIVLVLTKMDQHQALVDRFGGPLEFIRRMFPALLRILRQIPIIQVSAVQVEHDASGKPRPKGDSTSINLENPLRYCLQALERQERQDEMDDADEQRRGVEARLAQEQLQRRTRQGRKWSLSMAAIIFVGTVLTILILVLNI